MGQKYAFISVHSHLYLNSDARKAIREKGGMSLFFDNLFYIWISEIYRIIFYPFHAESRHKDV